jgi:hypothetical protein
MAVRCAVVGAETSTYWASHCSATSVISASVACWVKVVGRRELMAVLSWMLSGGSHRGRTENAEGRTERITALEGKMA